MLRSLCSVVVGAVLSGFAFLLLTGSYVADGPVVAEVSREHGVHAGDILVISGWGVAMLALAWLAVGRGRRRSGAQ